MGSLFHLKVRWGEDSIFNAAAGVCGEPRLAGGVESVHGFHQANGTDGDEIILIARLGVIFFGDVSHQAQIVPDEFSRAVESPARRAANVSISSLAVNGRGKLPASR